MKNKLQQCHQKDTLNNILNCIQFSYAIEDTSEIADLICNGTQHNLTKYNAGIQHTLIIYSMLGEYVTLFENNWIIQYSPTDFDIVKDKDFDIQFKIIDDES